MPYPKNFERSVGEIPCVNFMTCANVKRAVYSIKMKNSEVTYLFNQIYEMKVIPEQWKMAKITPVHKKGLKNNVSNYRPVANLCSASKIYEKLILQRIQDIEDEKMIDITNENQHGFKRGKSTTTAGLAIQSALARALDAGQYAILANLDLSST